MPVLAACLYGSFSLCKRISLLPSLTARLSEDVRKRSPTCVYSIQAPLKASHQVHLKDTDECPQGQWGGNEDTTRLCVQPLDLIL